MRASSQKNIKDSVIVNARLINRIVIDSKKFKDFNDNCTLNASHCYQPPKGEDTETFFLIRQIIVMAAWADPLLWLQMRYL